VTASLSKYIKNPIFLSKTALADFTRCPRAYYLKNIYRTIDDMRIQIASPPLTLGSTVHDTIFWYLQQREKPSKEETFKKYRELWRKFRLNRGGFSSVEEEAQFGKRGLKMLENFLEHSDCLEPSAPFLKFPKLNLIENIILNGNFDFVGVCEDGTLHIVDFKTGIHDEEDTIQLYIYAILAESNFNKRVSRVSFWYIDRDDKPKDIVLDKLEPKIEWLKQKGLEMKKAIEEKNWVCVKEKDGILCRDCYDYQQILDGKAQYLYDDGNFNKKIYFLNRAAIVTFGQDVLTESVTEDKPS